MWGPRGSAYFFEGCIGRCPDLQPGAVASGGRRVCTRRIGRGRKGASAKSLESGLVLHYTFDEDHGAKVLDGSPRANHGVVRGAKWTAQGLAGGAYDFDGRTTCISVPYDKKRDSPSTSAIAVCAW